MKPLMIYDFDGVFNPMNFNREYIGKKEAPENLDFIFNNPNDWKVTRDEVDTVEFFGNDNQDNVKETLTGRVFNIQWGSQLIEAVNSLVDEDVARHVMLTTWKEDSVSIVNPLMGLNVNEFIPPTPESRERYYISDYDYYQSGKTLALQTWLEEQYGSARPPIVWFDDVATHYFAGDPPIYDPREKLGSPAVKAFLVRADKGISRAEWDEASTFVRAFSA